MGNLELLEMAAKAAGIKHVDYEGVGYDGSAGLVIVGEHGRHLHGWNPLADDADAFRLALKLQIKIEYVPEMDSVMCSLPGSMGATSVAAIGDVELRYAIVQAAAQLGLTMP